MKNEKATQLVVDTILSVLCKKSKKVCALCDKPFTKETQVDCGRFALEVVTMKHPRYKSKTFKLCGKCYSGTLPKRG